ncbi:MAG: hypothetical protein AABZ06_08255 [Bdellovibrionota bacterium]
MIKIPLKPFLRVQALKMALFVVLTCWAAAASFWAYRSRPEIILIGLDEAGTRIITSAADPIIAKERIKFIREFLRGYYNYGANDYSQAISQVGSLMSDMLWREREGEFKRIAEQMSKTPLTQEARLFDLREVSEQEFEADIGLYIRSRLQERNVKYRVTLKIAPRKRNAENPYPLEVTGIHETEI